MRKKPFLTFCYGIMVGALAFTHMADSAKASEKIRFEKNIPAKLLYKLKDSTDALPSIQRYAKADLNEDGIYEYILHTENCSDPALCEYRIISEADRKAITLASVNAYKLELGNGYSHKIRNLKIFPIPHNDFDFVIYKWSPLQSSYVLSKGEG